jgi:hypothetical protein
LEFTVMSHIALGCVVGNRLADAHKATFKPYLRERLATASSRTTTLGCVTTGRDGRLSFVPNYLMREREAVEDRASAKPRPVFPPGQRVRVSVSVMEVLDQDALTFEPGEVKVLAGREEVVVERSECALLGLILVTLGGMLWAFKPVFLSQMRPGQDDGVLAAMTAAGCPL